MTLTPSLRREIALALIVGVSLGCICGSLLVIGMTMQPVVVASLARSPTHTPTLTPTRTPTELPTPTETFTPLPSPTPTEPPTLTPTSATTPTTSVVTARTPIILDGHFLMGLPVALNTALASPLVNPDPYYLYGTTEGGKLDVHHGEEFENPIGTPLFAVADGTVVTAGSDTEPICGDNGKTTCGEPDPTLPNGYYGNLIVLQLNQQYEGQRVFALYGHVLAISVQVGQTVKQGDGIGTIGETGVARGPHVHFEVRLGVNDYYHTRNAILWMTPLPGRGSLVGRYTDAKGNPVRGATVNFYHADTAAYLYSTETYGRDRWPPVNSDNEIGENFAMSNLLPGDYLIRIAGQSLTQRVTIQAGKLTYVAIGGP